MLHKSFQTSKFIHYLTMSMPEHELFALLNEYDSSGIIKLSTVFGQARPIQNKHMMMMQYIKL